MATTTAQDVLVLGTANGNGSFTGVTAGTSVPIEPSNHTMAVITLIGNGTISGGTVVVEEAFYTDAQPPYTGTWSEIETVSASTLTGNAQQAIHVAPNALLPTRVRISSAITGGGGISAAIRYQ